MLPEGEDASSLSEGTRVEEVDSDFADLWDVLAEMRVCNLRSLGECLESI